MEFEGWKIGYVSCILLLGFYLPVGCLNMYGMYMYLGLVCVAFDCGGFVENQGRLYVENMRVWEMAVENGRPLVEKKPQAACIFTPSYQ